MNKDEVMQVEAGREMDALVAEKVMGEKMPEYLHTNLHIEYPRESTAANWNCYNIFEHGDVCEWHPKSFSTDISAAWEVVEKMGEKFGYIERAGDQWICKFYPDNWAEIVNADTAPLAICRAALLAVEQYHRD